MDEDSKLCNNFAHFYFSSKHTCINSNIKSILWVIGHLFFRKYESKISAIKPQLEKRTTRLFWITQSKTHWDTSTGEEHGVIFKSGEKLLPKRLLPP
jgi:hypothetical protein